MYTLTSPKASTATNFSSFTRVSNYEPIKITNPLNQKDNMPKLNIIDDTARFYKKFNGMLEESYALLDIDDKACSYMNIDISCRNIILVLSGKENDDMLKFLFREYKSRIHTVIYQAAHHLKSLQADDVECIIKTESLKHAVTEAYRLVTDGQTILFPCIHSSFDFFSHLYLS